MKLTTKDVKVVENPEFRMLNNRVGLFNSSFQDFKRYGIPKAQLILTDIPFTEDDEEDHYTYSTLPFACIITKSCVITVCIADTSIVTDILSGRIKDINIEKRKKFSLQIQMAISKKFLWYLTQIQKSGQRVQAQLEKKMKNEDIMEMMDLQKELEAKFDELFGPLEDEANDTNNDTDN